MPDGSLPLCLWLLGPGGGGGWYSPEIFPVSSVRNRSRVMSLLNKLTKEDGAQEPKAKTIRQSMKNVAEKMLPGQSPDATRQAATEFYYLLDQKIGRLSLKDFNDIQAWYILRGIVHMDLADESACMEFCGVMVAGLLLVFFLFGALDFLLQYSMFSWGLLLTYLSSSVLLLLMWKVFEYGIDINSILAKDSRRLLQKPV